jgi:hypothetical protein
LGITNEEGSMSPQKHSAARRENRQRPEKSKPHGARSVREAAAGNAQKREQNKRRGSANVDQQGNRANVRQNTTRQGNRRSA